MQWLEKVVAFSLVLFFLADWGSFLVDWSCPVLFLFFCFFLGGGWQGGPSLAQGWRKAEHA